MFYHFGGVFISMFPVKIGQEYLFLCGFRDCRCSVLRALWVGVVVFLCFCVLLMCSLFLGLLVHAYCIPCVSVYNVYMFLDIIL